MALYDWWKKQFGKKESSEKINIVEDLRAVREFIKDLPEDISQLKPDLKQLEELEKERLVTQEDLARTNLQTQIEILEKVIERYEFLQTDCDINGLRIKKIANEVLKNAKEADLKDLVDEKRKSSKWKFLW